MIDPLLQEFPAEMRGELRANWISKLRDGSYPQTRGQLRDDQGYCCLGVALDLLDPDIWCEVDAGTGFSRSNRCYRGLGFSREMQSLLADMNDVQEKSFLEIADWCEARFAEQGATGVAGGSNV